MSEYIIHYKDAETLYEHTDLPFLVEEYLREPIVRCRDCKYLDIPDWDNTLAMNYGEPPAYCMNLSQNEWRMDGNRRVAETTFLEVEPDGFCAWGERK